MDQDLAPVQNSAGRSALATAKGMSTRQHPKRPNSSQIAKREEKFFRSRPVRIILWIFLILLLLFVLFAFSVFTVVVVSFFQDVNGQFEFKLDAQKMEQTNAEVEYELRECDTTNFVISFLKGSGCSKLAIKKSQTLGLGITKLGVAIDLLNGIAAIPAAYVDLLPKTALSILLMCAAPGLGGLLLSYAHPLGGGLGSMFVSKFVGLAQKLW